MPCRPSDPAGPAEFPLEAVSGQRAGAATPQGEPVQHCIRPAQALLLRGLLRPLHQGQWQGALLPDRVQHPPALQPANAATAGEGRPGWVEGAGPTDVCCRATHTCDGANARCTGHWQLPPKGGAGGALALVPQRAHGTHRPPAPASPTLPPPEPGGRPAGCSGTTVSCPVAGRMDGCPLGPCSAGLRRLQAPSPLFRSPAPRHPLPAPSTILGPTILTDDSGDRDPARSQLGRHRSRQGWAWQLTGQALSL